MSDKLQFVAQTRQAKACRTSTRSLNLSPHQENAMRKLSPTPIALLGCTFASLAFGREATLVRYPSYSNARIAFTYLVDIWPADEKHQNVHQLTFIKPRDAYALSSARGQRS